MSSEPGRRPEGHHDTAHPKPILLHPDDPAFHRMVAAFEGEPGPWLAVGRSLRDAIVAHAAEPSR